MFEKNNIRFSSFARYLHYRIKCGGRFWKELNEREEYTRMRRDELQEVQFKKLKKLLIHAYENVEFYRNKFRNARFNPYQFSSMKEFERVPVTTKEELKKAPEKTLKAKNFPPERFEKDKTSGSTSVPLFFFKDSKAETKESCAILHEQLRAGSVLGYHTLILRGSRPPGLKRGILRTSHFFSTNKFDENRFRQFVKVVTDEKIKVIEGFPTFLVAVAKKLKEKRMKLDVPVILSGGEMLFKRDRALIQEMFSAEVFDHYGAAEGMAIAMECKEHNGLHYDPTRFVVEAVDEEGKALTDREGVVCLTNLENYAMPFIRYLLNDRLAVLSRKCRCGLEYPLTSPIKGRTLDTYWTPSGRLIDFNLLDPYEHYTLLDSFQMVLHSNNVLEAKIVPKGNPEQAKKKLENYLKEYLKDDLKVVVRIVKEIPAGPTGKRPYIVREQ